MKGSSIRVCFPPVLLYTNYHGANHQTVIDYTKEDPMKAIPRGSVDFILDTTGQAMQFLSLMVATTSSIVSISTVPSGRQLQDSPAFRRPEKPQIPWLLYTLLNGMDALSRWRASRWGVEYQYIFLDSNGKDLRDLTECVEKGQLRPVVGARADLKDIEGVRKVAGLVYAGKGGTGKVVIDVR